MRPIRCGGIAENEEEYDAIRRERKKRESVNSLVFIIVQAVFIIAALIINAVADDDLFGIYYITYIVVAAVFVIMLCVFICAVYDKKDKVITEHTLGYVVNMNKPLKYTMNKPICMVLIVLAAFMGALFAGLSTISLEYVAVAHDLPVPIFLALFSLVSAVFSFTLFASGIMWITRWSKPWENLIGISVPASVPPEVKKVAEPSPAEHRAADDMRSFEEHLRFLRDMYDSGLLDKDEYAEAKKQAFARYGSGK